MFVTDPRHIKKCLKEHECSWCGDKIEKGTPYVTYSFEDGSWESIKMHDECYSACGQAYREDLYFEWDLGEHKRGSRELREDAP